MNSLLIGPQNKTDLFLQLLTEPLTLIDTTGEVAEALANRARVTRSLYFDPADTNHPVGLNVLDTVLDHSQLTEQLTDYLFHLFPAGTNTLTRENAQFLFENCVRILLCNPPQTLLAVLKLLSDTSFRQQCLDRCHDPAVLSNWAAIEALEAKTQQALFFSLRTKLGRLFADPVVRNIVGQPYNTFPEGTTIIANLDRKRIGNARAKFLGGLLIARSTGQVAITDYGFFDMALSLEQNRFTIGVNFLNDLTPSLQQPVLSIEQKYVFRTNKKDAEDLAYHVGVIEIRNIMDMDTDQYRIPFADRPQRTERAPSLKRLRALKRHTRACHTRPRLKVERDIAGHHG